MSNTRIHALLPGFSVALTAVLRLAKAVVELALLMGAIVLGLGLALGLLLSAVLKGRRPPSWRASEPRITAFDEAAAEPPPNHLDAGFPTGW
jgi:hypothetical protein